MSNGSIDRESPDVETVPEEPKETEPLDVPAFGEKITCGFEIQLVLHILRASGSVLTGRYLGRHARVGRSVA